MCMYMYYIYIYIVIGQFGQAAGPEAGGGAHGLGAVLIISKITSLVISLVMY